MLLFECNNVALSGQNVRKNTEMNGNTTERASSEVAAAQLKPRNYEASRFCIAPMMDWTDRHCRYFHRLLTRRALLYTEMLTTGAVLYGDRARLLRFDAKEHPVAVQLGGCEPHALAAAARICT